MAAPFGRGLMPALVKSYLIAEAGKGDSLAQIGQFLDILQMVRPRHKDCSFILMSRLWFSNGNEMRGRVPHGVPPSVFCGAYRRSEEHTSELQSRVDISYA